MSHLVPLCKGGRYYVILFERDFSNETTILDFHNRNFDSVDLDLKKFNKVKDLYEEIEYELKSDENDNFKYSRNLLNQILILLKREKLKNPVDNCPMYSLRSYSIAARSSQLGGSFSNAGY